MALSFNMHNLSLSTPLNVDIYPYPQASWTDFSPDMKGGNEREFRMGGADPRYPLVFQSSRRSTNFWHPMYTAEYAGRKGGVPNSLKVPGTRIDWTTGTDYSTEDSVAGHLGNLPIVCQTVMFFPGQVLAIDPADMLKFLLSHTQVGAFHAASAGLPNAQNMQRYALGSLKLW